MVIRFLELAALGMLATGVVWIGSDHLEQAADRLAFHYELPAAVQGAVLVAIGSSMPELMTTILAPLLHADFELGVSAIIGSAIFNIMVIPAAATLVTGGGLPANRELVYKEAQFYLIAVAVFLLTLSLAVIYFPLPGTRLQGELRPVVALAPVLLYGLYAFIQYQDFTEDRDTTSQDAGQPWRTWGRFIGGFVLILVGVEGLLRTAIGLGDVIGTPSFVLGLTIVAIATSIPDAFVSVRSARRDREITGVANVFGSNVFDLLVAVPAGVLIAGTVIVDFGRLAPLVGVLIVATIAVFATLRTEFELTRREAWLHLGLYAFFLIVLMADTFTGAGLVG